MHKGILLCPTLEYFHVRDYCLRLNASTAACVQHADAVRPAFKRPSIQIPSAPVRPSGVYEAPPQTCLSRKEATTVTSAGTGLMPWPAISPKELPSPEQAAWWVTVATPLPPSPPFCLSQHVFMDWLDLPHLRSMSRIDTLWGACMVLRTSKVRAACSASLGSL